MALTCCLVTAVCGRQDASDARVFRFGGAPRVADMRRVPSFYSSDPEMDAFLNEYLHRHLSFDERGIYAGGGPVLGATDHLWVIEWDCWMLPWVDRAGLGLARQGGDATDVILTTLARCTVDKYGYVFGAALVPEPNDSLGGYKPTFGWPWPKYNRNYTVTSPTGWEFNGAGESEVGEWTFSDLEPDPTPRGNRLQARVTGDSPTMTSPRFDCDAFQIPIVEVDIEYRTPDGGDARGLVEGLRLYWQTNADESFSEERSVGVGFSVLPPAGNRDDYAEMAGTGFARFPLFFPMYLHSAWGSGGRRITRLRVAPCGRGAHGASVSVNYIRATYDVRMTTTNSTLVNASARFYLWNGETAFLRRMMPRLRRAMLFLNEHLRGKRDGLLCLDWFVGHDGLGGDRPGHGIIGGYWDLLPSGRYDLDSSLAYWLALRNMAALEEACQRRGLQFRSPTVIGPNNATRVAYSETPATLRRQAERVRRKIEATFWVRETGRFCRNVDAHGQKHDYGFMHSNLQALAWGVGTAAQRESILSWLDGNPVPGDTSIGRDVYRWRFAPRTSTRRNTDYYFWPWIWDWRSEPGSAFRVWGDQMQDGGAIPATSLWEALARRQAGGLRDLDAIYRRLQEVRRWFEDVKAAGGRGRDFYRAYYDGHPERGKQQSPLPGGIGLDREFLSDASLGAVVPLYAFLGLDTARDGFLTIAPALPAALERFGVRNVWYRGRYLDITARRGSVVIACRSATVGDRAEAVVRLPRPDAGRAVALVNGQPAQPRESGNAIEADFALVDGTTEVRVTSGARGSGEGRILPLAAHEGTNRLLGR